MKKEISEEMEFSEYYLLEYSYYDGEAFITFNIVDINFAKNEITLGVTNRGKINVCTFDMIRNRKDGHLYFEYGSPYVEIDLRDFEEVK